MSILHWQKQNVLVLTLLVLLIPIVILTKWILQSRQMMMRQNRSRSLLNTSRLLLQKDWPSARRQKMKNRKMLPLLMRIKRKRQDLKPKHKPKPVVAERVEVISQDAVRQAVRRERVTGKPDPLSRPELVEGKGRLRSDFLYLFVAL